MRSILPLLNANKIVTLKLGRIHVSSSSTSELARYLLCCTCSLHTLDLDTNQFTPLEAYDNLVHSATVSKCLQKLSISSCQEKVLVLAERLAVVEGTLKKTDIKYEHHITDEGAIILRSAICSSHNKQVKLHLSLHYRQTIN